ncbi:MAG TPA: PEP/pyruvate-binding domain-containing protein [Hyphomonadaceae bacterium]|nr:PEP/pyruvate-binding domain-containing protein [Hyphomonadaceae bacterium]
MSESFILTGDAAMSPATAGGKGSALAKLAAKFPVPAFFVIPAEAFDEAGLKVAAVPEVSAALAELGVGPFAVRSSGREEDGADSAHAGQFETELNVAAGDVAAAAHRVWKSGFSETLAQYRQAKGLSGTPQPPAVVVQRMVRARAAGVAFSADPVSGDRSVAVVSAILGLADKLVGGEEDGDSYRIGADGKTLDAQLVDGAPVLSEAERGEVAAMARRSAEHFGKPQDIEWAFDESGLHMLQSRPITTLGPVAEPPKDQQDDLVIWDNSNIVESYPGVTSPLTFSFARYSYRHVYEAFSKLMGVPASKVEEHRSVFENMLGMVDGRVYYNLLNWYRALALFPGFKANRKFMEGMMGVSEALPQEMADAIAPPTDDAWEKFADNLNLARVGAGLIWHEIVIKKTIAEFYQRLNQALARPDAEIDAMSATALAAEYRRLEQQLLAKWDAPLVNDFLCMIAFGAAQKVMTNWTGDDGLAFLSNMLIGQGDIISAEPARLIREMGAMVRDKPDIVKRLAAGDESAVDATLELRRAFDAYIAKFGDRCTQELKLESRTLHEDPAQVLMAIAAAAAPRAAGNEAPEVQRELEDLVEDPGRRMLGRWLLKWAKARVRDRENLRFERTRLFGRVRRIFLAMGARMTEAGVLSDRRDVFNLTVEELLGAVEGAGITTDLRQLAKFREAELKAQLARPDPPERFSVRGAHITGIANLAAEAGAATVGGEMRKGLACCKGLVTAKVRVIEDPRVEALLPGEILVARHTDPGWIAVFANAAGVIAERGSLLSHSAIVAREMGVPCVVSLKAVTQWLKTGDIVRLDGGAGTVERTARAEHSEGVPS